MDAEIAGDDFDTNYYDDMFYDDVDTEETQDGEATVVVAAGENLVIIGRVGAGHSEG